MKRISIVIPVYNEEKNIQPLFAMLNSVMEDLKVRYWVELIFVNDGSEDETLRMLESLENPAYKIKIINLSRNFGQQNALKAGYDHSIGDAVICMDGDLQNPAHTVLEMISLWEAGYEVVIAKRKKGMQRSGYFKDISSRLFYKVLNNISEVKVEPNTPDFRLIDRKVVKELNLFKERELFYRGIVSWIGFKKVIIEYEHQKREKGKSSYNILKMMRLGLAGVTGFSTKPLYLSLLLGIFIIGIAFTAIIYAIVVHSLGQTISGWTSLIIAVMFFGGVQLFFLGIIGLYIGKIFNQVKGRPYYIVESTID